MNQKRIYDKYGQLSVIIKGIVEIGENVEFGRNVVVNPFVVIGNNVKIDDNVVIPPLTCITNNRHLKKENKRGSK